MLIAFCIYKYFPFGGLQRDFYRIANEIALRGHKVRIYTRQWQGNKPTNFEIITVPTSSASNNGKNKQFCEWVLNHLKVHPVDRVVGFNKMPGLDVYFTGDVCYAEKSYHKSFLYKLTPRYRHFLAYEKAVFEKGSKTKILLLTKERQFEFQKHYQTEDERFFLLPPGIDAERKYDRQPQGTRETFRKRFTIDENKKLLLQVCSNYELKGVDRSIRAIASLPDSLKDQSLLFVVGQDNPEKMKKLCKELGIENKVRFFGGRDDIAQFMVSADLMLHPARQEAAGIVILESLVAGLPILVSGLCGYAHYVNEALAGVVLSEPFNQNLYNQTLRDVLNNDDQLSKWSQNAKKFADHTDLYGLAKRATDIILE